MRREKIIFKFKEKKRKSMSSLIQLANKSFCLSTRSVYKKLEQSAVTKREKIFLDPDSGQGPYVQQQKIVFKFPSTNFLDPTTLHFEFQADVTATTNGNRVDFGFANGATDVIRRVRILAGSTELIDLDRYNTWCAFNYKAIHNWMNSVTQGDLLEAFNVYGYTESCQFGAATPGPPTIQVAKRNGLFHSHQFQCGIFQILQYIPLSLINDLQLEIYLDTFEQAIFKSSGSSASGFSYAVTNCRLYYDQVTFTPEFASTMLKIIETDGQLYIPFYQVRVHEKSLQDGLDNYTFQLNEKVSSLNQVYVIPLLTTRQNNSSYNGIGCFNPGAIWVQHQFRLNQTYFPPYAIDHFAEWMVNNMIACNQYNDNDSGGLINRLNASTVSAVRTGELTILNSEFLCEFYAYDFEREKCPELTSGYDTTSGTADLEFMIRYDNTNASITPKSNKIFLFYCLFDAMLSITANGITTVLR